jgi:TatD DNase family protein
VLFDSHCHLDFVDYDVDRMAVVRRAQAAGVSGILIPGTHPDTWARTAKMKALPGVQVALGVHPCFIDAQLDESTLGPRLREAALETGAVAIGECGLDKPAGKLPLQIRLLREQLAVARDLDLPVLLHCVKAHGALLSLLQELGPLQGVMHSYSGSPEMVPAYAKLGLCFSFGGALSWEGAKKPKLALQQVPHGRLLVESDGPDQPLSRRRGQTAAHLRSEPADVAEIAALAREIGVEPGWGPFSS